MDPSCKKKTKKIFADMFRELIEWTPKRDQLIGVALLVATLALVVVLVVLLR
jgi:hypothetical protein